MEIFEATAPPTGGFSSWLVVASYGGPISYKIEYEPLGNTGVRCMVRYVAKSGSHTQHDIRSGETVTTGDAWGNLRVAVASLTPGMGTPVRITVS